MYLGVLPSFLTLYFSNQVTEMSDLTDNVLSTCCSKAIKTLGCGGCLFVLKPFLSKLMFPRACQRRAHFYAC